jgi:hypothetical protein
MKTAILSVDDYPGIRDLLGHTNRRESYDTTLASKLIYFPNCASSSSQAFVRLDG